MLIDLHCHSRPLSQCSALRPEEVVDLARERGLDGACFTEHDAAWDDDDLEELARRTRFPVFSGTELSTDMGHILAFGLGPLTAPLGTGEAAFAAAERAGGLLFLAHPARDGLLRVDRRTVEYFASVEAINGSDSRLQNVAATGLAHGFRLPGIGGSDAHAAREVGRAATEFEARITSNVELMRELAAGRYRAVWVE